MSGKHRDKPGQLLDFPPHLVTRRPHRLWGPGWRGLMNYSVSVCPGLWLGYYCWWLSQQPLMQCVMQSWPLIGQVSLATAPDWLLTCCMMPGRFYPLRVMTGSGWDVPRTPDMWHTSSHSGDTQSMVSGLDHAGSEAPGVGQSDHRDEHCWPIRWDESPSGIQEWNKVLDGVRRGQVQLLVLRMQRDIPDFIWGQKIPLTTVLLLTKNGKVSLAKR